MVYAEAGSWLDWGVWDFVGAVAGVLSLVAIVFAIAEILKQRRRVRSFVPRFRLVGTATIGADAYHFGELQNAGSGTATIVAASFVGARPFLTADHRFKQILGPGERATVLLSAEEIEAAWLYLMWFGHEDSTRVYVLWLPVADPGGMHDLWMASFERTPQERWWHSWAGQGRPVGPLHYVRGSFRRKKSATTTDLINSIVSGIEAGVNGATTWPWAHSGGVPIANLPYVPPSP